MKIPQVFFPLTDPRSLVSSLVFHALLLLLASVAVLGAVLPRGPEQPQSLHGELEPTDNRAATDGAGGSPGDLGGEGIVPVVPSAEGVAAPGGPPHPGPASFFK
jgi:hypothetical protein